MENTQEPVLFYEKEYYVCSNFSSFEVVYNGTAWKTSEYAYQAAGFGEHPELVERIRNARSSHDAMKLAKITLLDKKRKDWDEVKLGIMEDICREKLKQHYYVQKKLLETGDRELIENSPRDAYWGWGENKDGQNNLGKVWMKLREEIRAGKIPLLTEDPEFK
jgi:ribA/ribD-fused uncharacterized protein